MRFTQCYSGTTVSAPSRSCLLTGTHSGHTAIRGNVELDPEGQFPLPADAQTIFHDFQNAGYKTGAFGKWGLGFIGSTGDPKNRASTSSMATTASCWHTVIIPIICGTMTNE